MTRGNRDSIFSSGFVSGWVGAPPDMASVLADSYGYFDITKCDAVAILPGGSKVSCLRPAGHETEHVGQFRWPNETIEAL